MFLLTNILILFCGIYLLNIFNVINIENTISQKNISLICLILFLILVYLLGHSEKKQIYKSIVKICESYIFLFLLILVFSTIGLESINNIILAHQAFLYLLLAFSLIIVLDKRNVFNPRDTVDSFLNKKYLIIIMVLIALAFLIRYHNLTITDPHIDEFHHLRGARVLLNIGETGYTRSFFLTSLVSYLYRITESSTFYEYFYWARIPGIIIGSLIVPPIFLLSKNKHTKMIGLIAGFLWTISPWAINMSRMVREYIYYLGIMLICILLMRYVLKKLLYFDKKDLLKIFLSSAVIIYFCYYSLYIDRASTLKFIIPLLGITYLSFFLVHIKEIFLRMDRNLIKIFLFIFLHLTLGFLFLRYLYNRAGSFIDLSSLEANWTWLTYFYANNFLHWWKNFEPLNLSIILTIVSIPFAVKKQDKNFFFILFICFLSILSYVYFFDRYVSVRYVFYILPFFIIITSYGLYNLFDISNYFTNKNLKYLYTLILTFFLIISFNLSNVRYSIYEREEDYIADILSFFEGRIEEEDIFISTYVRHALILEFNIEGSKLYRYSFKEPDMDEKVIEIVNNNRQGFLILGRARGNWDTRYPKSETFTLGEGKAWIIRLHDNYKVYRWENK